MELKSMFTYTVKQGEQVGGKYFLETSRTLLDETREFYIKGQEEPLVYNLEKVEGIIYSCLSYKLIITMLIREKYDVDDELSIQRQRDSKPEEFAEYNAYIENCKRIAKEFVEERMRVLGV